MPSLLDTIRRTSLTTRFLLALLLALACFGVRYARAVAEPGIDFWRPRAVVNLLLDQGYFDVYSRSGREDIYRRTVSPHLQSASARSEERAPALRSSFYDVKALGYQGIDVVHTPFLLALVRPFAALSYKQGQRLYLFVSLLCFFAATCLLSRLLGFSIPISLVVSGIAAIGFKAESGEMVVANVNNLQLLLIVLFLWLQRTGQRWADVLGGFLLAFGIALKPNLTMVLPAVGLVWIGGRLWGKIVRVGVGVAVGACFAFVTARLLIPSARWSDWVQVVPQLMKSEQPIVWGNIALASIVTHLAGMEASPAFFVVGGLLLTVIALRPLWTGTARNEDQSAYTRTFLGVSAGVLLMLLTPRLVWGHYVVIALPALLYVARRSIDKGGISGGAGALVIFVFTSVATALLNAAGGYVFSTLIWDVALLLIFAWLLFDLWNDDGAAIFRLDRPSAPL